MADSIEAIGLLQNLVVHNLPDGRCGVAAVVVAWRCSSCRVKPYRCRISGDGEKGT